MVCALSVNLNKIALIRNARGQNYPAVETFAHQALQNGAKGITIHPRPDQRHACYEDIVALKQLVDQYQHTELNIEGYPVDPLLDHVLRQQPHQFTLVPDEAQQLTSDHGWDLSKQETCDQLLAVVAKLRQQEIRVSLFMDPDCDQINRANQLGVERIELFTGPYAASFVGSESEFILARYQEAAQYALSLGLGVNAGHDLNLENINSFIQIANFSEVSIGHALTVEALHFGFAAVVKRYVNILSNMS